MFWRDNYTNDETIKEYLDSDDRTNFTYSETRSYRTKPSIINGEQPKMMRHAIHSHNNESNETNVNTDYIMASKSNSTLSTPRQKNRVSMPNTRRVLRSKMVVNESDIVTNGAFVRENEFDDEVTRQGYKIGILNTNTNNSGPDEVDHQWGTSTSDYHLSADEDQGSDTAATSNDRHTTFGTNNANIKKSQTKVSSQWFQKNMYGLPNDESDDVRPEFSSTISGDEQYDIEPFQNSNSFQKSKLLTKSKLKRTKKSDNSMICSPVAVLSSVLEYVWLCVITTWLVISYCSRHLTNYSSSPRWYLMPFYLPGALINSAVYWFAYSIDRLFGTTTARRWLVPASHSKRSTFVRYVFNAVWILFWASATFIALHCLIGGAIHVESLPVISTLSGPLSRIVGKECMEENDCCQSKWAFVRRLMFCTFSWPARWIVSNTVQKSNDIIAPKIDQSNSSAIDDILYKIIERIREQEQSVGRYNLRMTELEKDAKNKESSQTSQNKKLVDLTKEIQTVTIDLKKIQSDMARFDAMKNVMDNSVKEVSLQQKDGFGAVSLDIKNLRDKLEDGMKLLKVLTEKLDNSDINSKETVINMKKLFGEVQNSLGILTSNFAGINDRTNALESANVKSSSDIKTLKKEILDEVNIELSKYRHDHSVINAKLNEQMSKLEETIEMNYSKLSNKDDLMSLLDSHLATVESNIKSEVNSSLWSNVKEHVRNLFASSPKGSEQIQVRDALPVSTSSINPRACGCPFRTCRPASSCIRISKVRQMIADALVLYSADRIGMADYALESAGGTITTTRCTETYTDRAATLTIFGIPLLRLTNSPRTIIQPNINPGECWAMKGSKGTVVIQLSARVLVKAVSIDHIPVSLSPSGTIDSAIKDFEIKALLDETDTIGQSLGNFTYQMNSSAVQTFNIEKPLATNLVEMIIKSNYGNEEYTCIYRVRVHGTMI